jgi:hypothetical protein
MDWHDRITVDPNVLVGKPVSERGAALFRAAGYDVATAPGESKVGSLYPDRHSGWAGIQTPRTAWVAIPAPGFHTLPVRNDEMCKRMGYTHPTALVQGRWIGQASK